jgi:hypothetical protein
MNEDEVQFILEPIKERLAQLEQQDLKDITDECHRALNLAIETRKKAEQLMQRVRDTELRIEAHMVVIRETHTEIAKTLSHWAEYFSLRPTLNLRIDRTEKCTLEQDLYKIAGDMEINKI